MEKIIRNILYYKNYYLGFFETLKPEAKKKNLTGLCNLFQALIVFR